MSHPTLPDDIAAGDLGHVGHHNDIHEFLGTIVLVLSGTAAARPDADAVDTGTLYWATDTSLLSRSDGTTWDQLTAGAAAHGDLTGVTSDQHHTEDHAARHATGQDDALAPGDIGAEVAGAAASAVSTHEGEADPHGDYQLESEKGAANGYASLDGTTKVPTAQLGTGTADATTVLKGDRTWGAVGGGAFKGAKVTRSTNQSIPNTAQWALSFDTEVYDTDGFWVVGSPTRFTIPAGEGGKYLVTGQAYFAGSNTSGWREARLRLNGTTDIFYNVVQPTSGGESMNVSAVIELAAGDYIEYRVYQGSGGALNIFGGTHHPSFEITRLD